MRRLAAQQAVSSALAHADTVGEGVPALLSGLGECLGWDVGAYWERRGGALQREVVWGANGDRLDEPFHEALIESALRSGEPTWVDSLPAEAAHRSAVCLPIIYGGRPRAVIEYLSRDLRPRDEDLLGLMVSLGWQIGRFFTVLDERAAALAKLESLALTDELTGLANRRAWDAGLERELARARRADVPLFVAMLDLDRFKEFNDRHGHQQGDELLYRAAQAWQTTVRATDLLARYGGEEFALAFPAEADERGLLVVERLRHATPGGQTCSAGLAEWDGLESAAELVGRADKALYEAKRTGRDRTVRL